MGRQRLSRRTTWRSSTGSARHACLARRMRASIPIIGRSNLVRSRHASSAGPDDCFRRGSTVASPSCRTDTLSTPYLVLASRARSKMNSYGRPRGAQDPRCPTLARSERPTDQRTRPPICVPRTRCAPAPDDRPRPSAPHKRDGASAGENRLVAALSPRRSCPPEHVRVGVQPGRAEVEAAGPLDPQAGSLQRGERVTAAVAAASETGP